MINHRILLKMLFCFTLIAGNFIGNVVAGTRPIVTVNGEEIFPVHIQDRLVRLLRELGEPAWPKNEIVRMMNPVFSYLRAFTGRQFDSTLAALQRGDKYRPMIRMRLRKHKLPLALEALPMAESAFRYDARSSQGASRRNRSKKLILKAGSGAFLSYPSFSDNQIPFVHYEPIFGLLRQHYRCQLL